MVSMKALFRAEWRQRTTQCPALAGQIPGAPSQVRLIAFAACEGAVRGMFATLGASRLVTGAGPSRLIPV